MKPPPFRYHSPRSLPEALDLLRDLPGDVRVLAGGQSLAPLLNLRLARPDALVDLNRVEGLSYIREADPHEADPHEADPHEADPHEGGVHETGGARLRLGAMTRQREAEFSPLLAERCPLLVEALVQVGHPAVRNRGTIGGSLAHADPVAELPCAMTALGAEFVLAGPRGERVARARDFFLAPYETALAPGELLVEVLVPAATAPRAASFVEFSRRHGDFALAAAAVVLDGDRRCTGARVAAAGPAWTPSRLDAVERLVAGSRVTRTDRAAHHELAEEAGRAAETAAAALATHDDATDYQRRLAGVLVKRGVAKALERWSSR